MKDKYSTRTTRNDRYFPLPSISSRRQNITRPIGTKRETCREFLVLGHDGFQRFFSFTKNNVLPSIPVKASYYLATTIPSEPIKQSRVPIV